MGIQDREHLEVSRVDQLVAWLKKNHENSPGLWVVTFKKVAKKPSPSYDEIVRAALRFGWVDSVPGKVDEVRTKLYIAPRKSGSSWSQANKVRVDDLTKAGLMEPSGEAVVAAAKKSGSWTRIDGAQAGEIPADLAKAFKAHDGSASNFAAFPSGVKRQILEWIVSAKTEATRSKRVEETATLAADGIRANQWRGRQKA